MSKRTVLAAFLGGLLLGFAVAMLAPPRRKVAKAAPATKPIGTDEA